MELVGKEELYVPIVDLLASTNPSFEELVALPVFGESRIGILLDCLALLVHSGQVLPVIASGPVDAAPSQRFNRMIVGHARVGRIYRHLASPLAKLLMDKAEKTPAPLQVPVH
jgi:hypothetical protein